MSMVCPVGTEYGLVYSRQAFISFLVLEGLIILDAPHEVVISEILIMTPKTVASQN